MTTEMTSKSELSDDEFLLIGEFEETYQKFKSDFATFRSLITPEKSTDKTVEKTIEKLDKINSILQSSIEYLENLKHIRNLIMKNDLHLETQIDSYIRGTIKEIEDKIIRIRHISDDFYYSLHP